VISATTNTVTTTVSTTVRVIDSVLDNTTHGWTNTSFASSAGLTVIDVLMLLVTNYANVCHTSRQNDADFTAWHF
jgi:hypothetical protein